MFHPTSTISSLETFDTRITCTCQPVFSIQPSLWFSLAAAATTWTRQPFIANSPLHINISRHTRIPFVSHATHATPRPNPSPHCHVFQIHLSAYLPAYLSNLSEVYVDLPFRS
ncbi:hypothetical protein K435DRAFT_109036 [Dendrothele bispora CBS 962.96]|uniref:Uncharacterized protein n=1 Tax=Dendrothele bispora (strain CBS 962.96) TaxID=1314807 RepID=A0A4V4HFS9_DENBC|nr:hypothetical protein K435DRAFT_109036 [Dendrothele bispora CBS 962.96]